MHDGHGIYFSLVGAFFLCKGISFFLNDVAHYYLSQRKKKPPAMHLLTPLMPHQSEAVKWMLAAEEDRNRRGGLLADEMGLGKTLTCLALIQQSFRRTDAHPQRHLVVCPALAVVHWQTETENHLRFTQGSKVCVYTGSVNRRRARFRENPMAPIVLTSYDTLRAEYQPWCRGDESTMHAPLFQTAWSRVFLDEAHLVRDLHSVVLEAVTSLRAHSRWCITGTPFNNRFCDIAALCRFLRLEPYNTNAWWQRATERERAQWCQYHMLRRTKCVVPRDFLFATCVKQEQYVQCPLSVEEKRLYDYYTGLEKGGDNNPFERTLRLRQICNHPFLTLGRKWTQRLMEGISVDQYNSLCRDYKHMQPWLRSLQRGSLWRSSKIEGLLRAITASETQRVVVFSLWVSMLDIIQVSLKAQLNAVRILRVDGDVLERDRSDLLTAFKEETGPCVFLATLQIAALGIDLTSADTVVLVDTWYNPQTEKQAIDRVYRIGQQHPTVRVFHLHVPGTVEDSIQRLQTKKENSAALLYRDEDRKRPRSSTTAEEEDVPPAKRRKHV
jgi:SNF2 family DNA or RNA helicase